MGGSWLACLRSCHAPSLLAASQISRVARVSKVDVCQLVQIRFWDGQRLTIGMSRDVAAAL